MIELLPKPDLDLLTYKKIYDFPEEKAQGLAFGDGSTLYLSSKNHIFKLSISGSNIFEPDSFKLIIRNSLAHYIKSIGIDPKNYDHIGDIDYFDGLLFLPVRSREKGKNLLLVLNDDMEMAAYSYLPPDISDECCAVNPRQRTLYVVSKLDSRWLNIFDVSVFYKLASKRYLKLKIDLQPAVKKFWFYDRKGSGYETVYSIQGIAFSSNGRLYLTRYKRMGTWFNYIHAYNRDTGLLLSKTSKNIDFPGDYDEIEGISVHPSGAIYVAVALHHVTGKDQFQIYCFRFTDTNFPV